MSTLVVYTQTYTNTSGNTIKHNLRFSMNKRTHIFIKIYLSHFILERVGVSAVVRDGWRDIYSKRGLLFPISSSRNQGLPTPARLRVPRSTVLCLCLNLTAWFSSRGLLPVTHLFYPSVLPECPDRAVSVY